MGPQGLVHARIPAVALGAHISVRLLAAPELASAELRESWNSLGITPNSWFAARFATRAASRQFARFFTCQRRFRKSVEQVLDEVRRGKDSDFENPVNALVRLRSKNPWVGQSCVPGGKLHQVMRHNIAHAVEHAHSQWVFGRFIHIRPSSPGGRAVLVGKKETRVPKGTLMALASRGEKPEARGFRVVGPAQDPGNSVRPIRLPITRLTACAARTGSGGTLRRFL